MAPKKSKAEETAASSKKAAKPIAKAKGAAASKVSKSKPTPKTKAVAKPQPKASKKEKPVKKVAASKPTKVAPKPVKKAATPKPKKAATPKPKKGKKEDDEDSMEEDEFEVEEIRACKFDLGKKFYLIKWVVFDEDEKTWEPEENIFSKELITKYEERLNKTPVWQYYLETSVDGKRPGWHNYDTAGSVEVEKAYQDWKSNPIIDIRSVQSGSWHYSIDFNLMTQRNIAHSNHTVRHIRRFVPDA